MKDWAGFCQRLYGATVRAVAPAQVVPPHLPDPGQYKTVKVIAFGKAASAMAAAVEAAWPEVKLSGVAICRYGYAVPCKHIEVLETAHPVPDDAAVTAARRALEVASATRRDELLLVLVSGGGSSLMCLPADDITLTEKQRLTSALLRSGATIGEINCVRRHLSAIKGGRLAAAAKDAGHILTLAISDVVGDVPFDIASGPTVEDPTRISDAQAILRKYSIAAPANWSESVKPGALQNAEFHIIASAHEALVAAKAYAEAAGFEVTLLSEDITGEARGVACAHAALAVEWLSSGITRPQLLLSGGELTVTVNGEGQGGPNQEYALALLSALPKGAPVCAFAADTDGMDGIGGAAGAFFTPETAQQAFAAGLDANSYLLKNDSFNFFNTVNAIFNVKPSFTNVNDIRAVGLFPPR